MNIRRFGVGALFMSSVLCFAGPLSAQEIQVDGPIQGCILLLIRESVPARAEWSWWLSGGGGALWSRDKDSRSLGIAGAGAEVSFALAQIGKKQRYGGPLELRWGEWAKDSAFASGARLFATARSTLDTDRAWQLTFGVEIEPSWFFPPYSLPKWIGSGP